MKKSLAILSLLLYAFCHTHSATFNPSASKAYVDKQFADLRAELRQNGVFTNTLQVIVNVYTNTYSGMTFKTNITYDVQSVTTNYYTYNNTYTNTYQTNNNYFIYNITTNTYHRDYTTNYYYNITYKTNTTVNVYDTTNITTEVHSTTNLDVWVTNVVNIVTNNPVFPDPVYLTNQMFGVHGYTGTVIRATAWDENEIATETSTNDIVFAPVADLGNTYTNSDFMLFLVSEYDYVTGQDEWFAAAENNQAETFFYLTETWGNLGLVTHFNGMSPSTSDEMTLVYRRGMSAGLAFILYRADVSENERSVRRVTYNNTMAAGFSDEARRLVADGGRQWIDPTGVWWEVGSDYPVDAYMVSGLTLLRVPAKEEYDPNEIARFSGGNLTLTLSQVETYDRAIRSWLLTDENNPSFRMTTEYDYYGEKERLDPVVSLSDSQYETFWYVYLVTAYTNGVVRTNAVRKVMFDDDIPSANMLTKFDGTSVSTNSTGELQVNGFSGAPLGTIPVKSLVTSELEWKSAYDIAQSAARYATWGFSDPNLLNCYVQYGKSVLAVGTGPDSFISLYGKQNGSYGVAITRSTGDTPPSTTFGLMSSFVGQPYDAVIFVGTLFTDQVSGQRIWSGVSSIPIVFVFE